MTSNRRVSTDVEEKFPEYQRRGDLEIWRLHPYERTLIRWCREADGSYAMTKLASGQVELRGALGACIDLDRLWAYLDRSLRFASPPRRS